MAAAGTVAGTVVHVEGPTRTDRYPYELTQIAVSVTSSRWSYEIGIEGHGDRADALAQIRIGDNVTIEVEITGRRWDGPKGPRWYHTLRALEWEQHRPQRHEQGPPSAGEGVPF